MRFTDCEYYEVKGLKGMYGLAKRFDSVTEAIKGGKEMNESEIAHGYNPTEWIVTRTTWNRCFDEDGTFISESSSTVRMSIDAYL